MVLLPWLGPDDVLQSHLKVRAARVIATAAQIISVTAFPTGNAEPCCSTLRRPVDSAPVGSSSRTGRAPAGNLASGKDRKSTRLNSSHSQISYAVFCLKKKKSHNHVNSRVYLVCRLI